MDTLSENFIFQTKPNKFEKLNKFYYSSWYPVLITLITFVFWCADLSSIGMALILLLGAVSLFTNKDLSPTLPLIPLMVMTTSARDFLNGSGMYAVVGLGSILIIGLVYYLFHFRKKIVKAKLTIPFILITIALAMGGIGYADSIIYLRGLLYIFYLGPLMLILYTCYSSFTDIPREVDAKRYMAKLFLTITIVSCLELIAQLIRLNTPLIEHLTHRQNLDVGWGNRASIAIMLVLGLSNAFYLAESANRLNFLWYMLAAGVYACILLTCGRGGILFGTIEIVVIAIYLLIKSTHKKQLIWAISLCVLSILIVALTQIDNIKKILESAFELGLDSSGRIELYGEALYLFKVYPLFGVSLGYIGPNYVVGPGCIYWFHDTFLHVIASLGLFGLCCYLVMYVTKFKIMFKHNNLFSNMIAISLISYEIHNLIESSTFAPFPFLFTSYMMLFCIEYNNKRDEQIAYEKSIEVPLP